MRVVRRGKVIMPIRKEYAHWYGQDWKDLAQSLKWDACWKCQQCNARHGDTIIYHHNNPEAWQLFMVPYAIPANYEVVQVQIGVAHLNHKPWDRSPNNLKVLCRGCHLRHDAPHHHQTRKENRRRRAVKAGQLELNL